MQQVHAQLGEWNQHPKVLHEPLPGREGTTLSSVQVLNRPGFSGGSVS